MEIKELKTQLEFANKAYRSGNPTMSDQQFDDLLESYKKIVSENEFNSFRDSLHEVKGKVKHPFIMGSLDKLKREEPENVKKFILEWCHSLNVSAKVDGISCRLHYENGKLISASTRGDGTFGEDLTSKIQHVKNVPNILSCKEFLHCKSVDIRGELVILKDDFSKIKKFANARNGVAGIMGRKDWIPEDVENVTFVAYTILGNDFTKSEQFKLLELDGGFKVAWNKTFDSIWLSENIDKVVDKLVELANVDYGYDTDGLVICDGSYKNEEKYRPDACMAFKTNQLVATTRLLDVVFEGPSKNGIHVPVGIVDPVELGGAVISRASLYNLDFIKTLGLKYGSIVELTRSGDVIPKIVRLVENNDSCKDIELPLVCNCCGSNLISDGVNLVCRNKDCKDQVVNQLVLFIKNLGVKSASNATLDNLKLTSFKALVEFEPNKKKKSETKLFDELIAKMFSRSKLDLLCNMTCFDGLAETSIKKIIKFYSLDKLLELLDSCKSNDEFVVNLEKNGCPLGIGLSILYKFVDGLQEAWNNVQLIVNNCKWHCTEVKENTYGIKPSKLLGISVCFTGSLNTMSRSEASKKAEDAGFEVKSGVSRGLTYLVTNDKNSGTSKNKKAQQLGTKIIDEKEFLALIQKNSLENSVDYL